MFSPYNRTTLQSRMWIPMYDRMLTIGSETLYANSVFKYIKLTFSGKRLPMKRTAYDSTNEPDHAYFMLMISTNGGASPLVVTDYSRLTYTDV